MFVYSVLQSYCPVLQRASVNSMAFLPLAGRNARHVLEGAEEGFFRDEAGFRRHLGEEFVGVIANEFLGIADPEPGHIVREGKAGFAVDAGRRGPSPRRRLSRVPARCRRDCPSRFFLNEK